MPDAIHRQWLLLSLLPEPPRRIDTASLERKLRERGHTIHRRTIQRDLLHLATIFPIEADGHRKPFGWRWSKHAPPFRGLAPRFEARLRLHAPMNGALDRLDARDVVVTDDTVTCSLPDHMITRLLLLDVADAVELLAPASLRGELAARAARAAKRYLRRDV